MNDLAIEVDPKNKFFIQNLLSKFSHIYVYGAGQNASGIHKILGDLGYEIDAFVVTDMLGNPTTKLGKIVKTLKSVNTTDVQSIFVLGVDEKFYEDVCNLLIGKNFTNILIFSKLQKWKKNVNVPKLEITAKIGCGIQCKYCPQELLYRNYFKNDKKRNKMMSMEMYEKCIEHMPKNTIITFAGFVEPFLHPMGVNMIIYAHETGHPVELYTTFVGLSWEQYETIKDIPYREVVMHTPDIKKYANIHVTEEYRKIVNHALSHKKPNGEPFIDSANCQSEPSDEFMELAKGRIYVESSLVDRAGALEGDNLRKKENLIGKLECARSHLTNHWVLLPDGTVTLCCMDFGLQHELGNLFINDYEYIINDIPYKSLRQGLADENVQHILCRNCTSACRRE